MFQGGDNMLSWLKRSSVAHLLMAINFFMSGLVINALQAIIYVCVRPFSRRWYRILNQYLCYSLNCQVVFLAEWWSNSDTILYIDKDDLEKYYNKEHGYLIMNHKYEVDWLMGFLFCERIGVLGNCKGYMKKSIQYVPTMGWAWMFAESVFLDRNWDKDKQIIGKQITELVNHPTPIWLLLFAEGTRYTKDKHEASLKFAKEKNLPLLKHHLTPRTKGFTTSLPQMRGKVGGVYDVTLCIKEPSPVAPTMTNLLFGKSVEAHMYMERIPLEQVPEDEAEAAKWLQNLYVKKDKMVDSFKEKGDFFATSGVRRVEPFRMPRRWYSLVNTVSWAFITLTPIGYMLVRLLFSGSIVNTSIGIGIILVFFFMLSKLIEMTKISKSSSYGKSQNSTDGTTQAKKTE